MTGLYITSHTGFKMLLNTAGDIFYPNVQVVEYLYESEYSDRKRLLKLFNSTFVFYIGINIKVKNHRNWVQTPKDGAP